VAKPNYGYEKRQRELEKKKKKAEKAFKKSAGPAEAGDLPDGGADAESAPGSPDDAAASAADAPPDLPVEGAGAAG
jgi:hypothetical protein